MLFNFLSTCKHRFSTNTHKIMENFWHGFVAIHSWITREKPLGSKLLCVLTNSPQLDGLTDYNRFHEMIDGLGVADGREQSKVQWENEVSVEISSDLSCDSRENLCREDDAERDGQKETGVEKEGEGWMETEIESDSQTKRQRDIRLHHPSVVAHDGFEKETKTHDLRACGNCICLQYYCFRVCLFGKWCLLESVQLFFFFLRAPV